MDTNTSVVDTAIAIVSQGETTAVAVPSANPFLTKSETEQLQTAPYVTTSIERSDLAIACEEWFKLFEFLPYSQPYDADDNPVKRFFWPANVEMRLEDFADALRRATITRKSRDGRVGMQLEQAMGVAKDFLKRSWVADMLMLCAADKGKNKKVLTVRRLASNRTLIQRNRASVADQLNAGLTHTSEIEETAAVTTIQ